MLAKIPAAEPYCAVVHSPRQEEIIGIPLDRRPNQMTIKLNEAFVQTTQQKFLAFLKTANPQFL